MIQRFLIKWCLNYLKRRAFNFSQMGAVIEANASYDVRNGLVTLSFQPERLQGTAFVFFFRPKQLGETFPRPSGGANVSLTMRRNKKYTVPN